MPRDAALTKEMIEIAKRIAGGERYAPPFIDRHCSLRSVESLTTDGVTTTDKNNKNNYIKKKTIIKQARNGGYFTFYGFLAETPASMKDPYGYSKGNEVGKEDVYYDFDTRNLIIDGVLTEQRPNVDFDYENRVATVDGDRYVADDTEVDSEQSNNSQTANTTNSQSQNNTSQANSENSSGLTHSEEVMAFYIYNDIRQNDPTIEDNNIYGILGNAMQSSELDSKYNFDDNTAVTVGLWQLDKNKFTKFIDKYNKENNTKFSMQYKYIEIQILYLMYGDENKKLYEDYKKRHFDQPSKAGEYFAIHFKKDSKAKSQTAEEAEKIAEYIEGRKKERGR